MLQGGGRRDKASVAVCSEAAGLKACVYTLGLHQAWVRQVALWLGIAAMLVHEAGRQAHARYMARSRMRTGATTGAGKLVSPGRVWLGRQRAAQLGHALHRSPHVPTVCRLLLGLGCPAAATLLLLPCCQRQYPFLQCCHGSGLQHSVARQLPAATGTTAGRCCAGQVRHHAWRHLCCPVAAQPAGLIGRADVVQQAAQLGCELLWAQGQEGCGLLVAVRLQPGGGPGLRCRCWVDV